MLHCHSSMSRNNTENWFEHNKATVTGMTRADSQYNTTAYPGNPPPDYQPQDSSCKTAEIRLVGAWTCSMATALFVEISLLNLKGLQIIYLCHTSQWEAWSHSGFAPFPSHQSRTTHHAEMSGRDWHTQTHRDHRATRGQQEAGQHTDTLCSGVAHSHKERWEIATHLPGAAFEG